MKRDEFPNPSTSPSADEKNHTNLIKPQSVFLLLYFVFYDPTNVTCL